GGGGGGEEAAAVDHAQGVGQADQLVQVGRDEQHAHALVAGPADVVPDRGLGADVDAAGGVGRDQHLGRVAHLAADDELLLVTAGQGARRHGDTRGADVVGGDDALGVLAGAGNVDQEAAGVGRLGLVAEDAVFP